MNRQQRRKLERQKSLPTVPSDRLETIINNKIEKDLEAIKQEALKQAVHDLTAAFIITLKDEYGFGKKRMVTLLTRVNRQFECINDGEVTIEDIKEVCRESGLDYEAVLK